MYQNLKGKIIPKRNDVCPKKKPGVAAGFSCVSPWMADLAIQKAPKLP